MESDSDTTAGGEAYEEKPATRKKKGDGGKSVQPKAPKKTKSSKASVPQPQARHESEGPNQDPKEEESPNEASDHGTPHANELAAPEKATSAAEV